MLDGERYDNYKILAMIIVTGIKISIVRIWEQGQTSNVQISHCRIQEAITEDFHV